MNVQARIHTPPLRQAGSGPRYMSGFGNSFETKSLPGALPVGRTSPQKAVYGLRAEQLSTSAATRAGRYRLRPCQTG